VKSRRVSNERFNRRHGRSRWLHSGIFRSELLRNGIFHNVKYRRFALSGKPLRNDKRLPSVRRRLRGRSREIREEKSAKTSATRSSSLSWLLLYWSMAFNCWNIIMQAGPSVTSNTDGKIRKNTGNTSFTPTFRALS